MLFKSEKENSAQNKSMQGKTISLFKSLLFQIKKGVIVTPRKRVYLGEGAALNRNALLNALDGTILLGKHVRIGTNTELTPSFGSTVTVKDYSSTYSNCKLLGQITIERYCLLATNIYMSSGQHYAFHQPELIIKMQDKLVFSKERGKQNHHKEIHIHEDVWIGNGVFIHPGVTIGRGAVIGTGSVVRSDVQPYDVMVGMPARKIKSRFSFLPPKSLSSDNTIDFPYFYQGFNHMEDPAVIQQKGFQMIDHAILKMDQAIRLIHLEGTASATCSLSVDSGEEITKFDIKTGTFTLELNVSNSFSGTVNLRSTNNESIRIQKAIGQ